MIMFFHIGGAMDIQLIRNNKKAFLELLLLADPQEDMVDKYLERGDLFALYDNGLKSVCVVTKENEICYELKNVATYEQYQRLGYGSCLLRYIFEYYHQKGKYLYVGTGDSPLTIPFYEHLGFQKDHIVKNFFADHYREPIFECGKQLTDMIYLKKNL